jgi:hypothetical protein
MRRKIRPFVRAPVALQGCLLHEKTREQINELAANRELVCVGVGS